MSTSEPFDHHASTTGNEPRAGESVRRRQPITFAEWFVVLNGIVPLVMLMYDAKRHYLGADPIRNALHTSGSLAMFFLMLTLSITPAGVLTGIKSLAEYRRPLGLLTFFYTLVHVAVFVGYDQVWDWNAAWKELQSRRYLQVGAASLLLMLPLAITSSPWWVRLLSFKRWKQLHRLIYPAAVAAVVHYYMQSKADLRWQIGFLVVLCLLLLFRIVTLSQYLRRGGWRGLKKTARATATANTMSVRFTATQQTIAIDPSTTILDVAERHSIAIPSRCRSGICGTCRVRLVAGTVEMLVTDGLSQDQADESYVLACQARCTSDVVVDSE